MFSRTHKTSYRAWTAFAAAALGVTMLASCSSSDEGTNSDGDSSGSDGAATESIRVAFPAAAADLNVWVADREGFFEENGIDAELTVIPSPQVSKVPQTLGKQYDIALMNAPTHINAVSSGLSIAAVSGGYALESGMYNQQMITAADSGIESISDLEGKRIVVPTIAGNVNLAAMYWLQQNGVNPKSVELVEAANPDQLDLIKAGRVDAGEMQSPFIGKALEEGLVPVEDGDFMMSIGDRPTGSYWVADRGWAEENSDIVDAWQASLDEANAWIEENPEEATAVLAEETGVAEEMSEYITLPLYTTELTVDDLQLWLDAMISVNGFDKEIDLNDLLLD